MFVLLDYFLINFLFILKYYKMLLNSNYIYCYKKINKFLIYSKNSLILGTIFNYFIIILQKEKITINK
jgi:hypothetical protein